MIQVGYMRRFDLGYSDMRRRSRPAISATRFVATAVAEAGVKALESAAPVKIELPPVQGLYSG